MNLFCVLAGARVHTLERTRGRIESLYDQQAITLGDAGWPVRAVILDDRGAILGHAASLHGFLIYSGLLTSYRDVPPSALMDSPAAAAELLFEAFLREGRDAFESLAGQFVVAAYNAAEDQLVVLCDELAQRRLFYAEDSAMPGTCFSTHLGAIRCIDDPPRPIDRTREEFLLAHEFLPERRTVYEGVRFLAPGTLETWCQGEMVDSHLAKRAVPTETVSWPVDDEKAATRRLYEIFMAAVEAQCPGTDRIAVLLGGFDSALVAAALTRLGKKVETYTMEFAEADMNQRHVDTLQRAIGCEHVWVRIKEETVREGLLSFGRVFSQPASQAHYPIQIAETLRHVRDRGHGHCFTGDGCDELFLGYPMIYARARLFQRVGVVPGPLVSLLLALLGGRWLERRLGHALRLARAAVSASGRRMPARGHIVHCILDERSLRHLRIAAAPEQKIDRESELERLATPYAEDNAVRIAFAAKRSVGTNRQRNEGASTATGVTLRSPYQHPDLRRAAAGLPLELLRPSGKNEAHAIGKYLLARMAEEHQLLPHELIYQPKASPITAPVDYWYMGALRDDVLDLFERLPFAVDKEFASSLLRPKLAEQLLRDHYGIGHYCMHSASMLATYAAFNFPVDQDAAA